MRIRELAMLGAALALFSSQNSASAQSASGPNFENSSGQLETVVVTARRRAEDVEKIPVAVTALSADALRAAGVTNSFSLQNNVPSLTVSGNLGSRSDQVFTIRGQSQPFGGADPGVQTYFAEVPFGASQAGLYYDLDNVQVLKGPQGTLFGKNTTGGAILFEPKRPTSQFGGYLDAQGGNYNYGEVQGAVNIPLISDKLELRIAGDVGARDGFTTDTVTNLFGQSSTKKVDNMNFEAFRVSANMEITPQLHNYVVFDYMKDRNHGTGSELTAIGTQAQFVQIAEGFGLPPAQAQAFVGLFYPQIQGALLAQQALGPRSTTSSIPLFFRRDSWGVTDIAQYDVLVHMRLRNIFGYRVDREQSAFDYDGSALPILDISNQRTWESNSYQVTDEFQVLGESEDNSLKYIAGYYHELVHPNGYSEIIRDQFGGAQPPISPLAAFGSTEVQALSNGGTSDAVYGNVSYTLPSLDRLTLEAGGRYTWDHKVATGSLPCFSAFPPVTGCPLPQPNSLLIKQSGSFRAPSWQLAANYQVTDDTMVYATYRRGYKSGGFNSGVGTATQFGEFKPEYLTDVELGTKNNWTILGVPGRTNFDLYYGWYSDVQKNDLIAVVDTITPQPTQLVAVTFNAAKATVKGLEFESTFVPNENVQISAFYSYTDASYDKFILPQSIFNGVPILPVDHAGDPFAFTPKHKVGLTGQFFIPIDPALGAPTFTAQWYWQSKVWFTDLSDFEPDAFQNGYGLVNLRLDWNNFLGTDMDAAAFVNNVTDKTYKVGANALLHLTGTSASFYGPPRMWGVELRYRFGQDAERP